MLNGRKVAWRIHSYLQDTEDLTYLTLLNATRIQLASAIALSIV